MQQEKKMGIFPCLEIEGSPYEIGYKQGRHFRYQVRESLRCYQEMFKNYSELSWKRARELSRKFIPVIEAYQADYLEEMHGLAEGSGFDFEDILALNCRSELVFVGKEFDLENGGCTSIGISSDRGQNSDAFLAHNWDWKSSQQNAMVMLKIRQTNGRPDIFMVTEAGIIGKTGFNSAGLCLFLNALSTNQAPHGLPLHMAMRSILDCETLAEAIHQATRVQLGCCASFMLGHKNGECVNIEIENNDFDILYPNDGIIVHTNHFISSKLPVPPRKDTTKYKLPDTFVRLGRAKKLLCKYEKPIGKEEIVAVLQDHVEFPTSICRHDDIKIEAGLRMATVFSMIVNLTQGEIYFCKGNPCEEDYERFHI